MAALGQLGRDFPQRSLSSFRTLAPQFLGQGHHVRPQLVVALASPALEAGRDLTIARGLELGDE